MSGLSARSGCGLWGGLSCTAAGGAPCTAGFALRRGWFGRSRASASYDGRSNPPFEQQRRNRVSLASDQLGSAKNLNRKVTFIGVQGPAWTKTGKWQQTRGERSPKHSAKLINIFGNLSTFIRTKAESHVCFWICILYKTCFVSSLKSGFLWVYDVSSVYISTVRVVMKTLYSCLNALEPITVWSIVTDWYDSNQFMFTFPESFIKSWTLLTMWQVCQLFFQPETTTVQWIANSQHEKKIFMRPLRPPRPLIIKSVPSPCMQPALCSQRAFSQPYSTSIEPVIPVAR